MNEIGNQMIMNLNSSTSRLELTDVQRAYLAGRNGEIDWGGTSCQYYMEKDMTNVDIDRFLNAVKKLMQRHEGLRTIVCEDYTQEVLEEVIPPVQIQYTTDEDREKILRETRERMEVEMLPLEQPMFSIVLTQLDDIGTYRLHILLDMICCDGMSIFIFHRDLQNFYDGIDMEDISLNLRTYLEEEKYYPGDEKKRADEVYWSEKVKDFPISPQLPFNRSLKKEKKGTFSRIEYFIDEARWIKFEAMLNNFDLTPTSAFIAIFSEVISAFGGGGHFALNLTTLGRAPIHTDVYDMIGDFTKLLIFAVERKDVSLLENARLLQQRLREDMLHLDFPALNFIKMVEDEKKDTQLYPIVFTSLLDIEKILLMTSPFDNISYAQSSTPQVLLDSQVVSRNGGVNVYWDYVAQAFEPGVVESMFEVYSRVIEAAMDERYWETTLRDLRPLQDIEEQSNANNTTKLINTIDLLGGFRKNVIEQPEEAAVYFNSKGYSYKELYKRASQFSQMLSECGIEPQDRVMVKMNKSFDLIACIVGIVQIGAVYLPMLYDQPENRQYDIFKQAGAKGIVVESIEDTSPNIPQFLVCRANEYDGEFEPCIIDKSELAYIIYTSGSTGKPKGVAITHEAAMNTILAVNEYVDIKPHDVVIGLSSVSFDLSVYDIFGTLNSGAKLVVPTEAERIDPSKWVGFCRKYNVSIWNTVPALMDLFLDYCTMINSNEAFSLREVILSGDWIPLELFSKFKKILPDARLTSMGGATEASIWSNYFAVHEIEKNWASIPYGYPLPNQQFYVLDEFNRLCPKHVAGKLHIGGIGLAHSYYNEEKLTEKAFFVQPDLGLRVYDTGDYGRYVEQGCLIFMGRKDNQIKINGYRIELGEIQSALDQSGYKDSVIVVTDGKKSEKKILAYIKSDIEVDEQALKKKMLQFVPPYFIPERILFCKSFPTTANGKIDKKELIRHYESLSNEESNKQSECITLSQLEEQVLALLQEEFAMPELTPEDSLINLGISSLGLIKLANQLEIKFSYRPNINELIHYRYINDILSFYKSVDLEQIRREKEAKVDKLNEIEEREKESNPWYSHPVIAILIDEIGNSQITPEDELNNLGLSSLSIIRVANKLETHYGRRPSVHEMLRYRTINDMLDFYEDNDRKLNESLSKQENRGVDIRECNPILKCLSETLNMAHINEEDSFASLGISSLEIIRVSNKLEQRYGVRPSIQEMAVQENFKQLIYFFKDMSVLEDNDHEKAVKREVLTLYNRCKNEGIILWPEDDRLRFKAPQGALSQELKVELSSNKEQLLEFLKERNAITTQELTPLQMAYVLGRQNDYVLGDVSAYYYVEYQADKIDITKLSDAVNELIVRNEILRTIITSEGRMNVYTTNPGYDIEVVDETSNRELRAEMKGHKFELGTWPMFDIKVTSCKDDKYKVHIGIDCLILDGWSINMFIHQLTALYLGEEISVSNYTFREYLEEEQHFLKNKEYYLEAKKYWEKQINKLPQAPHLTLKNNLEDIKKPSFARKEYRMDEGLTFKFFYHLKELGITPSVVLCTAYLISLSKYSKNPDVTLNLTMFNRQPVHPDVQEVLGDFTNIALVGYHKHDKANFMEDLNRVQQELWNAIEYRSFNIINLLGRLTEQYGDTLAVPYVFTSLLDSHSESSEDILEKIGFTEIFAQTQTPQVLLDHQLYLKNSQLVLVLDYVEQAFEDEILDSVFNDYIKRVEWIARNDNWEELYEY